jgi:hypothetical protein
MNIQTKYIISVALLIGIIGVSAKPAPVEAKIMSLSFMNVFRLTDFSTKESSLAVADLNNQESDDENVDIVRQDRVDRINKYFEKRNMPLAGYGEDFVAVAEKCDIDWRLLPAIGVRESSGGKNQYNNNPFGWGSAKIKFKNFSDAISNVGEHLCGLRDATEKYYKDKTTYQKLWYYNGTVIASYPAEVIEIMEMF